MSQNPTPGAPKNDAVKKTLVRNCRSAVPAAPKGKPTSSENIQRKNSESSNARSASRPSDGNTAEKVVLSEPQLHSSLKLKENIEKMKNATKSVRFETKGPPDPQSKPSKKVNIRFDQKIYKDLIDLRVSEDDLQLPAIAGIGKQKETAKFREPVPVLSDYYRPSFTKEYIVKPYPPNFVPTPVPPQRPSTSSVLQAVKRWNVDDPLKII
ncbi:Hypothetical protein NTJ_00826 [Nesidiocoris tenuis]|uniref:Protein phosphatase 1 regulatory subunit 35 C-terminal domain-containing protein n=1 Tax=Nesidiocoris tenuis TaxID=355587 RepID=A0ABN7AB00_9HEMI|nr:Hypothetical protein NTJ_00826 [Nesidiocoris tenuis]